MYKFSFFIKFFMIFSIIMPISIFAQELDKAYLESLPDDVRSDLMGKINDKESKEKPQYKRPSPTMVDKNLKEIRNDGRFGKNIFNMMQSSFMPINDPNFDGSYTLDFGDMLEVQLTGQTSVTEELLVKRDGSINIPDIGKIYISGLSLDNASTLIKNRIKSTLIGTEVDISLTNIRDIQVLITGNAFNPGIYTLNGNSNALHALSMAGGIDDGGSYREILIIRDGKTIETLDLYDIFILGKSNFGPRLRSSDSILVKPHKLLVNAVSGVKRPSTYELKASESFLDLVNYANGLKSVADKSLISIERIKNDKVNVIKIELDNLRNIPVKDNDTFFVHEYKFGKVTIKGAVNSPGDYLITESATLKGIIERSGGYKDNAYVFAGFLNNLKTQEVNENARDKLYNKFLENILFSTGQVSADNQLNPLILSQLKNANVSGRVMAEFNIFAINQDPKKDTNLEDGDTIFIPTITQQVYAYGQLNNEGTVRYSPGKTISYYIENSGGITLLGDKDSIFVIQPNGRTELYNKKKSKLSFIKKPNDDILIYPGSIIYVPMKASGTTLQTATIWAPIVSSLALTLTSLSVLGSN